MSRNLDSNEEFLFNLLYVAFKRKYWILAVFLATFIGTIFGTYLITPLWKATAKVQVQANPPAKLTLFSDLTTPVMPNPNINPGNNMVRILTSRSTAEHIVRMYERDKLLQQKCENPEKGRDVIKFYLMETFVETPINFLIWIGVLEETPENYLADAVEEFQEELADIELEEETEVLNVSVWGESPEMATNMANTLVRILKEKVLEITRNPIEEAYNFTKEQFDRVEQELHDAQDALRRFKEEGRIVQMEEERKALIQRLDELENELTEVRSGLVEKDKRLKEAANQLNKQAEMVLSEEVIGNNPLVIEAKSKLNALEVQLAAITLEKTQYHPDVLALAAEIEKYRENLKSDLERIVQTETKSVNPLHEALVSQLVNLEIDRFALEGRKQALTAEAEKVRDELSLFPAKEMGLARLNNLAAIKQATYNNVKAKLDELAILKETTTSSLNLSVLDDALVYENVLSDWPKWVLNLIAGFGGSIILGIFFAFFVEYWDNSYKTVKEIEEDLELPVLGSLFHFGRNYGPLSQIVDKPEIKAAHNKLVDALLLGHDESKEKMFLIASAGAGEGRTTMALNLALTLSEREKNVLLIDADLRNPKIDTLLNIPAEPGMIDVFFGNTSLQDAIRNVAGLSVLPAGRATDALQPAEIIGSDKMKTFLSEIRDIFEFVIIDAPAIKSHKDPLMLSSLADGTLLLVEANKTQRRSILMAQKRIEEADGKLRGIILNKQVNPIPAVLLDLIR